MSLKPYGLSVRVMLEDDNGLVLIVKRSDTSDWNPCKWEFPGGKLDPGESFDDALRREVREETGLTVKITALVGAVEDDCKNFRIVHLLMKGQVVDGTIAMSHEHTDYKWVSKADLASQNVTSYIIGFLSKF